MPSPTGTLPGSLSELVRARVWPEPVEGPVDLWVQAVSVGEVEVAATFVAALRARRSGLKLLITSTTPAGTALLGKRFRDGDETSLRPFPLDLPFSIGRLLDSARPGLLVLVETELWPVALTAARRRGVGVLVVNGRLSERSLARLSALPAFLRRPLSALTLVATRGEEDARRFVRLGVPGERVLAVGDLKLDREEAPEPPFAHAFRRLSAGRAVVVAGSVADEEVEPVLEASRLLRQDGLDHLLLLAPRRPESFDEIARRLAAGGVSAVRRSRPEADGTAPPEVFLLDTVGELASAYRLGDAAFLGGTLAPKGGHNVLEPLRAGLPVLVGPSTANVREAVDAAGPAVREVADAAALHRELASLLRDPEARRLAREAAGALFARHGGAASRAADLALDLLDRRAGRGSP